ncbi:hypothetical protein MTO96_003963 [Rhipicephalus appendiculatus]
MSASLPGLSRLPAAVVPDEDEEALVSIFITGSDCLLTLLAPEMHVCAVSGTRKGTGREICFPDVADTGANSIARKKRSRDGSWGDETLSSDASDCSPTRVGFVRTPLASRTSNWRCLASGIRTCAYAVLPHSLQRSRRFIFIRGGVQGKAELPHNGWALISRLA